MLNAKDVSDISCILYRCSVVSVVTVENVGVYVIHCSITADKESLAVAANDCLRVADMAPSPASAAGVARWAWSLPCDDADWWTRRRDVTRR